MYIHGQFRNIEDDLFSVHIVKGGDRTSEKLIGEGTDPTIFFSDDPIKIETTCDDTFTHIIKKSLTLNLLTSEYLGDYLFSTNERDVVINVFKGDTCIFAGYVEPNVYTQPYAYNLE
jgi:hypothetical protein